MYNTETGETICVQDFLDGLSSKLGFELSATMENLWVPAVWINLVSPIEEFTPTERKLLVAVKSTAVSNMQAHRQQWGEIIETSLVANLSFPASLAMHMSEYIYDAFYCPDFLFMVDGKELSIFVTSADIPPFAKHRYTLGLKDGKSAMCPFDFGVLKILLDRWTEWKGMMRAF